MEMRRKIRKKHIALLSTTTIAAIAFIAILLVANMANQYGFSIAKVYGQSNPDAYGNRIAKIRIRQYKDTGWIDVVVIDTSNYTEGMTVTVPANKETIIAVHVWINKTLTNNDQALCDDYTRVYLNVSGVYTNLELEFYYSETASDPNFWEVWYRIPYAQNFTTATDTTYQISALYQVYY